MKKHIFSLFAAVGMLACHGAETEVRASSFGFDKTDATACLQKAIDSGARKVIVDNTGSPWYIAPVKLRSDLELVFARGVQVVALEGSYRSKGDCMFSGGGVDNVTVRGEEGAVLSMRKKDYQKPPYLWSEWRHCLSFRGARNVVIRDLTLRSSGGDGIYISNSGKRGPCRNVLIENVVSDDHHRQGISIISAVDLLIRGCKFINTAGTAPQCGIDLEPNKSTDMLVNCVLENCEFYGNASAGATVFLPYLSTPVSIVFRNCSMHDNQAGIRTTARSGPKGEPQKGSILFENCKIFGNRSSAVGISGQQKDGMTVTLRSCVIDNRGSSGAAVVFNNSRVASNLTGVTFDKCTIHPGKQPLFEVVKRTGYGVEDIRGEVKIVQDDGKVSAVDWAALKKQHPEDRELQKFDFAEIAFEKLRPLKDTVEKQPSMQNWRIRQRGTCLFYAARPGTYEVKFDVNPIRPNRAVNYQVTVKLANNTLVAKFTVTEAHYTRKFETSGKRLYILEITRAGQTVSVSCSHAAFGFLVQNRLAFFRGGMKDMYFYVQPGVKNFMIEVLGTGAGEWVTASLRDPAGREVASCKKNPGAAILRGERADASKGEVWNLRVLGREDHALRFGAPLIPVVSPDRDMVFTCGE